MAIDQTETSTTAIDRDRLWTVQDVSSFLLVPVATLYGWRHRGEGPRAMRIGKHLRYEPTDVKGWAREQLV